MYCALPSPRYLDTFVGSRSEVSRADVRSQSPVPMLPNKSEDEPMVTKKKSKIPCLSLASILPALEGTLHGTFRLTFIYLASSPSVAFTGLVALTFLSWSGVM